MTIPGMSSHGLPPNRDWLVRWIKQIEAKVDRNAHARSLENSSIGAGGLTVLAGGAIKFVNALGQLLLTLDGTNGLVATALGLITNSNLANPLVTNATYADTNSATFAWTWTDLATSTLTVPDGFTKAFVTVTVNVGASRDVGSGPDWLSAYAWIDGAPLTSQTISATCPDGGGMTLTASWVAGLTGLSGGDTISAGASAAVGSTTSALPGWIAGSGNGHSVMTALFTR